MLTLLVVCLLWLRPLAPSPFELVTCSVCEGKGQLLQPCLDCGGDGKRPCGLCGPALDRNALYARSENLTPELRAKLRESMRGIEELTKKMMGEVPKGFVHCPSKLCARGKVTLQMPDPCKYCAGKGSFPCAECGKKGVLECLTCRGKRVVMRACEACLGAGRAPDPKAIESSMRVHCPWCLDAFIRECKECDADGMVERHCQTCRDEGSVRCPDCLGTLVAPCMKCYASGNLKSFIGVWGGDCNQCKTTGRIPCTSCARSGKAVCKRCMGTKPHKQRCAACDGDHKRPCWGCFRGAYAAWESAGEACARTGATEEAIAWFEIARGRVAGAFASRREDADGDAAALKELDRERQREESRLQKRIAAVRASVAAPR